MCQQEKLGGGNTHIFGAFPPLACRNERVLTIQIFFFPRGLKPKKQEKLLSTKSDQNAAAFFFVDQTGGFLPDSCLERLPAVLELRFGTRRGDIYMFFLRMGAVEF